MTATDEFRKLLDERGVEWYEPPTKPNKTWFPDENGINCSARPWSDTLEIKRHGLTPEQAIAATLGSGMCEFTLEYDRDEVERRKQMYEAEPFGLFPQDMPDSAWTCSNCGQQFKCHYDRQTGHVLPIPDWMKHCPNCGRKVMSE